MIRWFACFLTLLPAAQAQAHPHIFVDTALRLEINDRQEVTGIEVSWSYDDFFTLLIFEDMGLDPDGDAQLTEAELARLQSFDLDNWPDDFEGDLYLYAGTEKLVLGHPEAASVRIENGRIISAHHRSVTPTPADGLLVMQYDPTYYVSYEVTRGVDLPAPCRAAIAKPDLDAAEEALREELAQVPEDQFEVMQIGDVYADRITISCDPSF
ncbi:DUF1007 family protein [Salipiger sp. P9]|uniref:DUF1007 family protein n=1 Tax=Salipiger pentaromativorans TaxID=2943193 RepID=UPI0021588A06|nr:DUF1007 family protein [Salipiger pentaromativorans]MCR8546853.1 DUF1007 family protein [Salipiger pentaromativorans]